MGSGVSWASKRTECRVCREEALEGLAQMLGISLKQAWEGRDIFSL